MIKELSRPFFVHKILFISGPTGVGKTKISLELADAIATEMSITSEIVNFDSLLFYKELSIGTAKPLNSEMKRIQHHLINIRSIEEEPINASDFCQMAQKIITKIFNKRKLPLLVGGSGFYLRALVKGMISSKKISLSLERSFKNQYTTFGIGSFREYLKKYDPRSLKEFHENDHYRIMRACEHHKMTGNQFSRDKEIANSRRPYDFSCNAHPHWNFLHLYLDISKEKHHVMMKKRIDEMLRWGFLDEIKALRNKGGLRPLRSVGYKEALSYLNGEIKSWEELAERIFISTRQLAKAQRTFFKKITPKLTFDPTKERELIKKTTVNFLQQAS